MKKGLIMCLLLLCSFFTPFASAQEGRGKAEALLKESLALADDGKTDEALDIAKKAIEADPSYPDAHDNLGYLFLKKGQFDEAVRSFDSALQISPRMRTSKTGKGLALLRKGDLKGAETILKEALVLNPYPSMTHYALGLVYQNQSDYKNANKHYKEKIKTYKVRIASE